MFLLFSLFLRIKNCFQKEESNKLGPVCYGTRGISRGARKLARTPSLSKKKKDLYGSLEIEKETFRLRAYLVPIF